MWSNKVLQQLSPTSWQKYWLNYRDCTLSDLPNSCYPHASYSYSLLRYEWQLCPWLLFCAYNFYFSLLPIEWNLKILTQHNLPIISPTHRYSAGKSSSFLSGQHLFNFLTLLSYVFTVPWNSSPSCGHSISKALFSWSCLIPSKRCHFFPLNLHNTQHLSC